MTLLAKDVEFAPDNDASTDGATLVSAAAPQKNLRPAIQAIVAYLANLNLPEAQTADQIASAIANDASAVETLKEALELVADEFHQLSDMGVPHTFEDADDWVTAAAGAPTSGLVTIDEAAIGVDATHGPEWQVDGATVAQTVYQRFAIRPKPGRIYRVRIQGYVEGSNSCTMTAVVAELDAAYAVTAANKASAQTTTFVSAPDALQTLEFTLSVDQTADVDLNGVPFIRIGATIGPDAATATNLRLTEIRIDDVTAAKAAEAAAADPDAIAALIAGDATALEQIKDAIVADLDTNDAEAIATDIANTATALSILMDAIFAALDGADAQEIATAIAGDATARGTLGAGFSDDIPIGAIETAAKSGSDATLITGTAGAAGTLAEWNADGDLVEGPDILDEDDMSADSADAVPTQQSVKAYVDTSIAAIGGGSAAATEQATTSGTEIDFTSIPAGVSHVWIMLDGVSFDGGAELLSQIGTAGGWETSGYECGVTENDAQPSPNNPTNGFGLTEDASAGVGYTGVIELTRSYGNKWFSKGILCSDVNGITYTSSGRKELSGELDRIRLTSTSGNNNFDAGSVNIRYM